MIKVEIILPKSMEEEIIKILKKSETGFTLIDDVKGMGESGMQDGLGLSDAFQNVLFMVIIKPSQLETIINKIKPICDKAGGMILSSEIKLWNK